MPKKPKISYKTIRQNKTLGEFLREDIIQPTQDIAKFTFELIMKWTKKK